MDDNLEESGARQGMLVPLDGPTQQLLANIFAASAPRVAIGVRRSHYRMRQLIHWGAGRGSWKLDADAAYVEPGSIWWETLSSKWICSVPRNQNKQIMWRFLKIDEKVESFLRERFRVPQGVGHHQLAIMGRGTNSNAFRSCIPSRPHRNSSFFADRLYHIGWVLGGSSSHAQNRRPWCILASSFLFIHQFFSSSFKSPNAASRK